VTDPDWHHIFEATLANAVIPPVGTGSRLERHERVANVLRSLDIDATAHEAGIRFGSATTEEQQALIFAALALAERRFPA
jgi:hypothetical protein